MKKLKIEVDRQNQQLTTFGMFSETRGYIDGTIEFSECGIDPSMDDEEIEEFLIERHDDYIVIVSFR